MFAVCVIVNEREQGSRFDETIDRNGVDGNNIRYVRLVRYVRLSRLLPDWRHYVCLADLYRTIAINRESNSASMFVRVSSISPAGKSAVH